MERSRLIPGNHESRSLMTQAFPELFPAPSLASCFSLPGPDGWRLIGIDTHDTDASEGWNGDTDDEAFKAHGWDGQGGVVKPTQYGTLYLAVGCALLPSPWKQDHPVASSAPRHTSARPPPPKCLLLMHLLSLLVAPQGRDSPGPWVVHCP